MKTKIKLLIVFSIFCIVNNLLPQKTMAQNASVNFQVFYDELSPYGTWIENPEYGYVWIPDVDPGFAPYATNGYWVYTENGWTWVSGYSWGWATFHYGRWYSDPYYGPMWIPDNEWGPGWVSWRSSSDYYGWAPMGPGISISLAYGNGYYEHFNNYTFVRGSHFGRRDINNYYINNSNNTTIINNTTVINNTRVDAHRNTTYSMGPNRTEVEKRGGKKITAVPIKESTKPGERLSNNQLQIYRPQIKKTTAAEQKPAPARVANLKDVKSTEQRIKENPTQKSNPADKQLQRKNQDVKQQPAQQQQRNIQPAKQQPDQQQQRNIQPAKQQPAQQQQRNVQPAKQQPAQPQQRNVQPVKQQPAQQQQRNVQPAKQQPSQQHQRNVQQAQPQPQPQPHQQPQQRNSQQAQPQENKNEPRHSN
ncbi:MAG: hypothetical protein NTZ33_06925 [Bacteroidetes bacterium]|nr:hypothetical protein [Bacteroidota bacterium]